MLNLSGKLARCDTIITQFIADLDEFHVLVLAEDIVLGEVYG